MASDKLRSWHDLKGLALKPGLDKCACERAHDYAPASALVTWGDRAAWWKDCPIIAYGLHGHLLRIETIPDPPWHEVTRLITRRVVAILALMIWKAITTRINSVKLGSLPSPSSLACSRRDNLLGRSTLSYSYRATTYTRASERGDNLSARRQSECNQAPRLGLTSTKATAALTGGVIYINR